MRHDDGGARDQHCWVHYHFLALAVLHHAGVSPRQKSIQHRRFSLLRYQPQKPRGVQEQTNRVPPSPALRPQRSDHARDSQRALELECARPPRVVGEDLSSPVESSFRAACSDVRRSFGHTLYVRGHRTTSRSKFLALDPGAGRPLPKRRTPLPYPAAAAVNMLAASFIALATHGLGLA